MKHRNEIERLIYETATHCDSDELKKMLSLYGRNPALLEVIMQGIDAGYKIYGDAFFKTQEIRNFCVNNDVIGPVRKEDASLSDLFKLVSDIAKRLEKLESAAAHNGKRKTRGLNA